ncbi:hypothetical protein ES702_02467 [subsurface metagenome]
MNAVLGVHLKYRHRFLLISDSHVSQLSFLYPSQQIVHFEARNELPVSCLERKHGCRY